LCRASSAATYRAFVREYAVEGKQARAGAIAIWLLLNHPLWDYPLRPIALANLFCFFRGAAIPALGHAFRYARNESRPEPSSNGPEDPD
jgi:hypothetical protein